MEPNLLTIDEARTILRVGRNVMYDLTKNGLPHIKVGKQIRIPREALYSWIKNQTLIF
ncbi:helix-turn-helix domain-containing protein [Paenibacillus odorifer]|uniref:helix-turn-helix domain-containing protein n=1 Tax=Paenibacillus odorifer TaxID=189426 RepID=UPI0009D65F98|nr:helix-turn-helix domain-containing protein [Paenibacillus odorifer]